MRNSVSQFVILPAIFILLSTYTFGQKLHFKEGSMPACPYPISYTQPDGSLVQITLKGDENLHWAVSSDGYTLVNNGNNGFDYAVTTTSGDLISSGISAKDPEARNSDESKFLSTINRNLKFSRSQIQKSKQNKSKSVKTANSFPAMGTRNLLMILVNFNNTSTTYTQSNFNNFMNQAGYSFQGATGSFKDYYLTSSLGQDTIVTTVVAWVTVSNAHNYYGPSSKWAQLAYDAVVAAHVANPGLDFSIFDNDGDGVVDGIAIIHEGTGQEASGNTNDVWSHSSDIRSGYNLSYNGTVIGPYTMQPEITSGYMTPIGVMCHEFGHNLGLPDLYDTDYSSEGMGDWDIMAGGSWNNGGRTPPVHNAWSKYVIGWINPVTINNASIDTLRDSYSHPDCFRLNINGTGSGTTMWNEFYLLENRQKTGWNAYLPGHGMIIYHIDGTQMPGTSGTWPNNTVNDTPTHQDVDIVEADGTLTTNNSGDTGDPFPGTSNKTDFTDNTTPNSRSWAGTLTGKPINHITENTSSGIITFWLLGGAPTTLIADFYANHNSVNAGDSVSFFDNSGTPFSTTITSYQWSFPGGSPSSFTGQVPPPVAYSNVGSYQVSLKVMNSASATDSIIKTAYITVNPAVTCNWITQASNFTTSGRGIIYISIVNPSTVWCIGNNGSTGAVVNEYTRTTDGGATWLSGTMTGITSSDVPSCISGVSGTKAYALEYNTSSPALGGVYVTTNGGTNWTKQTTAGFNSSSFPDIIHFFNSTDGVCVGDPNGGYFEIYTTTNGGTNWVRVSQTNIPANTTGEYGYTNIYDAISDTIWFATNKGRVYRSYDKGYHWTVYAVSGFTDFSKLTFNTANDGYAQQLTFDTTTNAMTAHIERVTHNGGQTWVPLAQGPGKYFGDIDGVPGVAGEFISVGRDSTSTTYGSAITFNYGSNWSQIDQGTQYISTKFFDANTGWAGGFNTTTAIGIYKYHSLITSTPQIFVNNDINMIYPNPVKDNLSMVLYGLEKNKINICVYNMTGTKVFEKDDFNSGTIYQTNINMAELPEGVYIAIIRSGKNIIKKKIIKG